MKVQSFEAGSAPARRAAKKLVPESAPIKVTITGELAVRFRHAAPDKALVGYRLSPEDLSAARLYVASLRSSSAIPYRIFRRGQELLQEFRERRASRA